MKIKITSDLHTEFHRDFGKSMLRSLQDKKDPADVIIIAGDLGTKDTIGENINILAKEFDHVIYVAGNHDYYGTTKEASHDIYRDKVSRFKSFNWLERGIATINGQKFIGCTLWFPFDKENSRYEYGFTDFIYVIELKQWVYSVNHLSQVFLNDHVDKDSIVITHHLPTMLSVPDVFIGSTLNRFFVCDMKKTIEEKQPKIWIHGHTHGSCDYKIGETRIICNPMGYVGIEENLNWKDWLIVEV